MPKTSKPKSARGGRVRFAIAIMAAGKGTRLKSKYPKVLHQVGGQPMLRHVIGAAAQIVPAEDVFAIIGHEAEMVRHSAEDTGVGFVLQSEQRGTGHAIMTARDALKGYDHVLVLSGDVPLIRPETIKQVRDFHLKSKAAMTILTAEVEQPRGYGRVIRRGDTDNVEAIVEEKALTKAQRALREINSGIYAFATQPLFRHISKLKTDNAHKEFYLTDMAGLLVRAKQRVVATVAADSSEVIGSNTRAELAMLDRHLRAQKCAELMESGVTIFRPDTCVIDSQVEIAPDTVIEPCVQILGRSKIGSDCRIRSFSVIENTEIADQVEVRVGCVIENSIISPQAIIGPYSHLRPGSEIGEGAHVGNFVETKKSRLGKGAKANHLSYLGDSLIGDDVNVGAGTITCNYDGVEKHATVIDDGAFIGSDATLVAPLRIGRGAYIGAGSCITDDVPADALAVGRGRQVVKHDWARQRREERAMKSSG